MNQDRGPFSPVVRVGWPGGRGAEGMEMIASVTTMAGPRRGASATSTGHNVLVESLPSRATVSRVLGAVEPVLLFAAESAGVGVPQLFVAVAIVRLARNLLSEPEEAAAV
jgi:hypothetical protein